MPHATLRLQPGVDQNRTLTLNEAAISSTNLVRFVPDKQGMGLVQKLGGWLLYPNESSVSNVVTTCRALWAWEDTNAQTYLGVGCVGGSVDGNGLSVIYNLNRQIITPKTSTYNVNLSVDGVQTTNGSATVIVNATGSNVGEYDSVYIQTPISVGGIVLFGTYPCAYVSTDSFSIQSINILGQPNPATATVAPPGGGAVPTFGMVADSAVITVTLNDHGYAAGDIFAVVVPVPCGKMTLYGNYTVNSVLSANTFTITSSSLAAAIAPTDAVTTGTSATISFAGTYAFTAGDTIVVAGATPGGLNTAGATVTAATSSSVTYANATAAGTYTGIGGTIFNKTALMNGGKARYLIYRMPGPLPPGTGYGVGGYGVGGYGVGTPGTAATGTPISSTDWTLDNWGSAFIACPVGGGIYVWNPISGDVLASIIPSAPPVNDGVFVAMPQRQLVAWGTTSTGIQDPLLIRWSDVGDYDQWIPLPTNQAGDYRIPRGSAIISALQGPQQGIIWTDLAVWAMQYVGPPYVYQFNEIGTGCGLIARKAAASMNGVVYWMGQSQFFKLGPGGVEPIRCPIWDVIFQDLDTTNLSKLRAAANSQFGEISWHYPTKSNGGEVSAYVKYNVLLDQWDFGYNVPGVSVARTAWVNQSVLGPPIGAGVLDGQNYLYQHETSPDASGVVMPSSFQTGYFSMSDGEYKVFVDQVWPDMKWGYYNGQQIAQVNLTFYVTDYPAGPVRTYGPFDMTSQTQFLTPRFRGRLMSIKMESDPNVYNSFWRLGGMRYRLQPDGKF